jgi:UDP-glucose 4-epimerase
MINRNLQGKQSIIYGDGEQTRCFSYIEDCISCLEKMALDRDITYQTINIGPDEGTITVKEMSKIVAAECGIEFDPIYMPDRPREVKHAMCSSDKARALLNYETKTDIKTAIKNTVDYIKSNGVKSFDYSYPIEIINEKTPKTWKNKLI